MDKRAADQRTIGGTNMRVFKFGGASIKDAEAVRNMVGIVKEYANEPLVIVVSAMEKTTNALEEIVDLTISGESQKAIEALDKIKASHFAISTDLLRNDKKLESEINNIIVEVEWVIEDDPDKEKAMVYDQIVGAGEMLSTRIISAYLEKEGISNTWMDARDLIQTDNTYQDAKVNWEETSTRTINAINRAQKKSNVVITQGFIGSSDDLMTTTLGREGSDFSAAILAFCTDAESVTIWKDVPGVMNADPKKFNDAELLPRISYQDAVELAYFGTSVIHPKTIKPLQNKNIPLFVRSFSNPDLEGTRIDNEVNSSNIPSYIIREDQVIVSIHPRDFSFIVESNLQDIFQDMSRLRIRSNVMQNSALSFSFSMDYDEAKLSALQEAAGKNNEVRFNRGCRLLTVRYFNERILEKLVGSAEILLEQRTRNTVQLVLKNQ
ncbi:MAG: aspartate kinase [Granulosicoccus sp.]|jgi:aspartate kinase